MIKIDEQELGNTYVNVTSSDISCGIRQLEGVADCYSKAETELFLYQLMNEEKHRWGERYAMLIFSDVVGDGGGNLADYIKKKKLGKIITTPSVENPNTGNDIELFCWIMDTDACEKWYESVKLINTEE